eukprot:gene19504-25395_t
MILRPRSVTSKAGKAIDELTISGLSWFGSNPDFSIDNLDPENPQFGQEYIPINNSDIHMRKRPATTNVSSIIKQSNTKTVGGRKAE